MNIDSFRCSLGITLSMTRQPPKIQLSLHKDHRHFSAYIGLIIGQYFALLIIKTHFYKYLGSDRDIYTYLMFILYLYVCMCTIYAVSSETERWEEERARARARVREGIGFPWNL